MSRVVLAVILLMACSNLQSQSAIVTPSLNEQLGKLKSTDLIQVNIVFAEQIHYGILNAQFKEQNIPLAERVKTVMRQSKNLANNTQLPIIEFLKTT